MRSLTAFSSGKRLHTVLSKARRAALERKGYDPEEIEEVEAWVLLVIGLLKKRNGRQTMEHALTWLRAYAEIEWRACQRDPEHLPTLWTGQLGPMPGFTEDEKEDFLCLTGGVLLSGSDSPRVTVVWMREALERAASLAESP